MIKITIIGAGSVEFSKRLVKDILSVEELSDSEFRFMDVNENYLEMSANICRKIIKDNGLSATVYTTTNRKEALKAADYVLCTARIGGIEALENDIHIPLKYGVEQCVGDTLGPGGVFYAMRSIPFLLDVAKEIREVSPDAVMLNYQNPMAINTWALNRAGGIQILGLCHGVQSTHKVLAKVLGIPHQELDYICAGINHQAWFIQLSYKGRNVLPELQRAFENNPETKEMEPCRIDVLKKFGYFSTESNGHLSEYLPWYRKRKDVMQKFIYNGRPAGGPTAGYLNRLKERNSKYENTYPEVLNGSPEYIKKEERSHEHASYIMEALITGRTYKGDFNIVNKGYITNLPDGCVVETPCYVDKTGVHPVYLGNLPMACAATCRASVSVQEMAVEAALTGNRELVKLAVLHDPLTAAVCTTDEVWKMCDEMFEANALWMPQFNGEGLKWEDIPAKDIISYERTN